MLFNNPHDAAAPIAAQIAAAQHILILSHINPDGDAIGSLLGTTHVLRGMGKQVTPLALPPLPAYTNWLPAVDTIELYAPDKPLPPVDLIFVVDTASIGRLGSLYPDHAATLDQLPMIIVDHHVTNDGRGTLNLINPLSASACELVFQLFVEMGAVISPAAATCFLLGMITDTQSFQTTSTNALSLRSAADLFDLGADRARIIEEVYNALPASSASLIGLSLTTLRTEGQIAWAVVTPDMMLTTGAEEEAADEVVRSMQRIGGIRALVLFKQHAENVVKLSFRSHPPYNVAQLAQEFGGGGHTQASGATLHMSLEEAQKLVLPRLRSLVQA